MKNIEKMDLNTLEHRKEKIKMRTENIYVDMKKTLGNEVIVNRLGVNTFNNKGTVVEKGSFVEVCLFEKARDTLMVYLPKMSFTELSSMVKVDDLVEFKNLKFSEYKADKSQCYGRAESVLKVG